jgi:ceramidase
MIDLYCERLGPGLWGEPLNTSTNLAFFLAAWGAGRLARRAGRRSLGIAVLIALMAAIGTGSALFHTFATPWARVLDVLPILVFQLYFLWLYCRTVMCLGPSSSGGAVAGLLIGALVGRRFPAVLNGSLAYAPALVVLIGLGVFHFKKAKRERLAMLAASGAFALGLLFRTIDSPDCRYVPVGSHFLWHVFTALVTYLSMKALIRNSPSPATAPHRAGP